ncbi:MAG TPA: iron-sulfur cluster assembly scaffold protein, partial [Anaerolineales bacterium]|nr:iron-sulfur cluster assembly scaffold protein [Anaerolineales bacterium]
MPLPYSAIVMEHFRNPRNVGRIEDADAKGVEGSPACGDMVAVYLKVDPETHVITDIKFESYGCASNIATGSIITELAKGKTIEEAKKLTWKDAAEALGGLPPIKVHCSVLAIDGLRAAIENYEEKHGLVKERKPTTEELVRKRLKRVVNPVVGLDIVRSNLVKDVEVKDGV